MKNRNRGFTLAELLIVVAIVGVLVAISVPIFNRHLESSREAVDLSNVRSAYSEVMAAVVSEDDEHAVKVVPLKQKIEKWQSKDPVTIAGITHSNNEGDTANWIGYPVAGGKCEVSYQTDVGVILNWKGSTVKPDAPYPFDINCDLQKPLLDSGILGRQELITHPNFEIDSRCNTGSQLVAAIMDKLKDDPDNLLNYGTWAYLGKGGTNQKEENRYLFWTSVDTNDVGPRRDIPVIISTGDGRYYVSKSTTATRQLGSKSYVAIADHLAPKDYKACTDNGTQYQNLKEAYDAYTKLVTTGDYKNYKDTLPKK